jgi:long-chain-alcohol oxidase
MIKDLKGFTALVSKGSGRAAPNSNDIGIECDVVIVGSGSGGGVVAAVLAEKGYKVVVLDKGEYYAPDDISTLEGPSILSLYEKSGALATEDGGVSLAAARTIGGGSTVNWCVCFKTPENVRNEWAQDFGLQLFASEKYEQAMEVVWKRLSVQEVTNKHNLSNSILQNGCKRLGLNFGTLARNSSADHYCGWCSFGCPTGQKQSTPETWLLDAVKTNNTLILSNCEAKQILHSPNLTGKKPRQALGVMATMEDGTRVTRLFVKASATIVACGSLMTPPLLLNSGLENKNIGKNLHLHPGQAVWGIFPEGSGPEGTSYEGGIMTAYSRVSRRDSSSYGALLETLCLHPGIFAAFIPWCSGKFCATACSSPWMFLPCHCSLRPPVDFFPSQYPLYYKLILFTIQYLCQIHLPFFGVLYLKTAAILHQLCHMATTIRMYAIMHTSYDNQCHS